MKTFKNCFALDLGCRSLIGGWFPKATKNSFSSAPASIVFWEESHPFVAAFLNSEPAIQAKENLGTDLAKKQ
jgi:hypothetical protein